MESIHTLLKPKKQGEFNYRDLELSRRVREEASPELIGERNSLGELPVHVAIRNGHLNTARALAERMHELDMDMNEKREGKNLLQLHAEKMVHKGGEEPAESRDLTSRLLLSGIDPHERRRNVPSAFETMLKRRAYASAQRVADHSRPDLRKHPQSHAAFMNAVKKGHLHDHRRK